MDFLSEKQGKILEFVKIHHAEQKRKYTGEPYYSHLLNVAEILHKNVNLPLAVEAALCHDLFEDTNCTHQELTLFLNDIGYDTNESELITSLTIDLSDVYTHTAFPNLNRAERKALEVIRMSKNGYTAQTVKYADLIDNAKSIIAHDKKFAKVYLNEKRDILLHMKSGDINLYAAACALLQDLQASLSDS